MLLLAANPAVAQEDSIHWAYASYFGTGRYSLDGRAETEVLTVAPGWTWREATRSRNGQRSPGIRFRFPLSIGAHELSSFDGVEDLRFDNVNAVSFVPGADIEFPVTERWRLKSLTYAGLGWDTGGDSDARIYRLGFRGQRQLSFGRTEVYLVSGVERMGYSSDNGASSAISLVNLGFDFSLPLATKKLGGDPLAIHWHVAHTTYLDRFGLDLGGFSLRPDSLDSEWELGVAFGKREARIELGRLKFDRLGLAYRFDADGEFSGVGVVIRSLFDR